MSSLRGASTPVAPPPASAARPRSAYVPEQMINELTPVCDLIDRGRPVLRVCRCQSIYRNCTQYWLQLWSERIMNGDVAFDHWLSFPVARDRLAQYLTGKNASLRDLMLESVLHIQSVVRETDPTRRHFQTIAFRISDSPEVPYLPTADSYFDENSCSDLARVKSLKNLLGGV